MQKIRGFTMTKGKLHPAWRMLVAGALLIGGGQGLMSNVFGMFLAPISEATGEGMGVLGTTLLAGNLAKIVAMFFVGKVMDKVPLRPLLIVCIVVRCCMFMMFGQFKSIVGFYVAYPLYSAFGAIPCTIVGPLLITNWFKEKRGLVMGIMMSFGNIGAIFASQFGGRIIESSGYSTAFLVLGGTAMVLMLIASFLVVPHPSLMNETAYGEEKVVEEAEKPADTDGVFLKTALRTPAFYYVLILVFLLTTGASFSTFISPFGLSLGLSAAAAAGLISVFQIGTWSGSYLVGVLNDVLSIRTCCILCFSLMGLSGLSMVIFGGSVLPILYVSLIVFGIACSMVSIQPALLTGELFGRKDYANIYSKVQVAHSLAGLVAATFYGFMFDMTESYRFSLIVVAGIGMLNIVFVLLAFHSRGRLSDEVEE